ncbi:protein abscisic acid-insensitive 5 [Phtheirospermum japonicum]|uniref:Protein abscisic acid-insensitive 5 n=1 Tax=Phtheirospermum japonicum TaxID=374723 RepID=A0A830CT52_9LAMI|nr:protein abscisic acid-insensitive 5 [Phtheirospermum japonicum]
MAGTNFEFTLQGDLNSEPEQQLSSIYSLTLDEFQNLLSTQNSKNFGSMNMDEFLNSIMMAEDNQAQGTTSAATSSNDLVIPLAQQTSLPRQSSFSIPELLGNKTFDEVWSEIHRNDDDDDDDNNNNNQRCNDSGNHGLIQNTKPAPPPKQPTFSKMTLEDFLARAGIVREPDYPQAPPPQQPQSQSQLLQYLPPQQPQLPTQKPPFGMYPNIGYLAVGPNYAARSVMAMGGGVKNVVNYQGSDMKPPPAPAVSYGGRSVSGNEGGYGGVGAPVSPVSSDGMGLSPVDSGNQYGLEMGMMRRQRRNVDVTVEKAVERRQRRTIKNTESAVQYRAKKQAHMIELEVELNQIREENKHLKRLVAELRKKLNLQYCKEEEAITKGPMQPKSPDANEKSTAVRRGFTGPC